MPVKDTINQERMSANRRTVLASIGETGVTVDISASPPDNENSRAGATDMAGSSETATAEQYIQAETIDDLGVTTSGSSTSVPGNAVAETKLHTSDDLQIDPELESKISARTDKQGLNAAMTMNNYTLNPVLNPAQQFQIKFYNELTRRDLGVETNLLETVFASGESEYQRLGSITGSDWDAVLTTAGSAMSERDAKRVSGFGRILTDLLISPLDIPDEARETVLELGATINLWIATFDRLLDAGHNPDDIHSSYGVRAAFMRNSAVDRAYERLVPPERRAIYRLLSAYAHTVDELPHTDARRHVRQDIDDCFSEMHQKGRELWYRPWSAEADKITSVNAITILGLPGWLATSSYSESRYQRHVDWMEGVGWFFGLIDDIADVDEDAMTGANNAVQTQLETQSDRVVIERIADKGERLFTELNDMTTHTDCELQPEDVFRGTINSWLAPGLA